MESTTIVSESDMHAILCVRNIDADRGSIFNPYSRVGSRRRGLRGDVGRLDGAAEDFVLQSCSGDTVAGWCLENSHTVNSTSPFLRPRFYMTYIVLSYRYPVREEGLGGL